jgi:hypothetical protein
MKRTKSKSQQLLKKLGLQKILVKKCWRGGISLHNTPFLLMNREGYPKNIKVVQEDEIFLCEKHKY